MMEPYGKVYNLHHREVQRIFEDEVLIQEKVDGSQFSFMMDHDGRLRCRSHHTELDLDNPGAMFQGAVNTVRELAAEGRLASGYIFRGEVLAKPRQNVLAYDRVPKGNLILFEVQYGTTPSSLWLHAEELGLEYVPTIYRGWVRGPDELEAMLNRTSILGGQQIEGLVIKNYSKPDPITFCRPLKAKLVSAAFKESQTGRKAAEKSGLGKDPVAYVIEQYRTEQRWQKAVQHLREAGLLQNGPEDIGPLIAEASKDLMEEEGEAIRELLFKQAWKKIAKGTTQGLAEWYKQQLRKGQA